MIPYWVIAVGAFLCVLAFLLAGHAFEHKALWWVMLPFALVSGVYIWFSIVDVPADVRAFWGRGSLAGTFYVLAFILTLVSLATMWLKGRRRG